jgi:hypothetical protein
VTSPATGAEGAGQVTGGDVQQGSGSSAPGQGGTGQQGQQGGQGHPAYQQYLSNIPQSLHSAVIPAFQQWDKDMAAKLGQVQQQYAPFQSLLDGGKDPQRITAANQLLDMIEENPAAALSELASHFGVDFGGDEGDGGQGEGELGSPDEGAEDLPQWAQEMMQGHQQNSELLDLVAQKIVQDGQEAELQSAVDDLESQLSPLLQQAGIPFEGDQADTDALDFVFAQLTNGASPQDAVSKWTAFKAKLGGMQASQGAPQVLPGGGGLPTQQVDPKTLSQKDRRALAVQRIRQLQGGGTGG